MSAPPEKDALCVVQSPQERDERAQQEKPGSRTVGLLNVCKCRMVCSFSLFFSERSWMPACCSSRSASLACSKRMISVPITTVERRARKNDLPLPQFPPERGMVGGCVTHGANTLCHALQFHPHAIRLPSSARHLHTRVHVCALFFRSAWVAKGEKVMEQLSGIFLTSGEWEKKGMSSLICATVSPTTPPSPHSEASSSRCVSTSCAAGQR